MFDVFDIWLTDLFVKNENRVANIVGSRRPLVDSIMTYMVPSISVRKI